MTQFAGCSGGARSESGELNTWAVSFASGAMRVVAEKSGPRGFPLRKQCGLTMD